MRLEVYTGTCDAHVASPASESRTREIIIGGYLSRPDVAAVRHTVLADTAIPGTVCRPYRGSPHRLTSEFRTGQRVSTPMQGISFQRPTLQALEHARTPSQRERTVLVGAGRDPNPVLYVGEIPTDRQQAFVRPSEGLYLTAGDRPSWLIPIDGRWYALQVYDEDDRVYHRLLLQSVKVIIGTPMYRIGETPIQRR